MSTISSRFYITALEDGTTLHGNLVADKSLTQAWNGTSAIPNWAEVANQPTIYLTLLSGSTMKQPDSGYKWFYNEVEIQFEGQSSTIPVSGGTISGHYSTDHRFFKTTKSVDGVDMPALRVTGNVAGDDNVDVDSIRFEGSMTTGTAPIDFSATVQIRVSRITATESLGLIEFVGGVVDITQKGQIITLVGTLYGSQGPAEGYTTRWYLNNAESPTAGSAQQNPIVVDGQSYVNAFQVREGDVVDRATVRCEFVKDGVVKYTAYESIDDMQDPEYMYVQYNGANSNAASLRSTDNPARFYVWVGTMDDASVDKRWNQFDVKLLNGSGNVIMTTSMSGIPDPDGTTGLRRLTSYITDAGDAQAKKYYFELTFAEVNSPTIGQKNVTGFIYASQAQQS